MSTLGTDIGRLPATGRKGAGAAVILGIGSLLVALLCLFEVTVSTSVSPSWPSQLTVVMFLWFGFFVFTTYRQFGTIYLFGTAYLISLLVFHLGQVSYHGLGIEYFRFYETGSDSIWLKKASWLSLFAAACFGIGIAIAAFKKTYAVTITDESAKVFKRNLSMAYWFGLGFLLAATFGLVLTLATVGNVFAFSRTQLFEGVGDTRGFGLFLLAAPSAAVMLTIGAQKKYQRIFAYSVAAIIGIGLMLMGYRSSALFAGLIGAVVWVKVGRKLPLVVAILAIIFVSIAIPTVRVLRDMGTMQEVSTEKLSRAYAATSSKETILEIGGTNALLAKILQWVPEKEPYWYGASYYWAMSVFVPNFGMKAADLDAGLAGLGPTEKALRKGNPARWYIYKTNRWKFDHGQGSGFSTVAEPYLNFGLLGVVVYFVFLGFLLGRLDQVDLRSHPKTLVFAGSLLWPLVKTVRNSFGVFIKPLGLMLVVIAIWKLFTFWKSHR